MHCRCVPHYIFQSPGPGRSVPFRDESYDLPDLTAAMQKANSRARAVLRRHIRCGPDEVRGTLDIQDANRQPVARIYLRELMLQIS